MYEAFYGLNEGPFGLSPDPKYIFKTDSYLEAISSIRYGIARSKGIIVLVGEVGTGKTMTLRSMLQQISRDILSVYIFNPFLTPEEFFEHLTAGFGLSLTRRPSKPELFRFIGRFLAERHSRGQRTLLIVDEAHGVPTEVLEEIRLLANFETNSEKLLQIILSGQPELRDSLNRPVLRQLKQRISLRCYIKPLELHEVAKYIRFRLKVAGADRVDIFDDDATALIADISQGIPRVINNICDNALLYGFASELRLITRRVIEEVADVLDISPAEMADGLRRGEAAGLAF